jgi:hypothetical protein
MAAEAGHAPSRVYIDQSGNLHLNGATVFDAGETDITANVNLASVTATPTELNALHGQGAVAADFAKLHAVTTTAAQMNEATAALGTDGLARQGTCRVTYDFAVDGGAVSAIVPSAAPSLPAKATVTRAWAQVLTGFTGGAGATIALSIEGANDLLAAGTIANKGFDSTGYKELIPDGTAAKFVQTSVGTRKLTLTVAVNALTAGKAIVILDYVVTA